MADQLNMRNAPAPSSNYFNPFKNRDVFRLDEGYSEETRSQAGSEMPAESRQLEGPFMDSGSDEASSYMLPEWIGNLNESERSGECCLCWRCGGAGRWF